MLIVLSGKARVGKDTVASMLVDLLKTEYGLDYKCIAYADRLKEIIGDCFNLTKDHLYGDLKTEPLKFLPEKKGGYFWTTRDLLQYFGTDVFRGIDPDYWVNYLINKLKPEDNYIITDGRFGNEINWVLNSGGLHIRVLGKARGVVGNTQHPSETTLDDFNLSGKNNYYFINQFETLTELKNSVKLNLLPLIKEGHNG